jgi:hypothetical protein
MTGIRNVRFVSLGHVPPKLRQCALVLRDIVQAPGSGRQPPAPQHGRNSVEPTSVLATRPRRHRPRFAGKAKAPLWHIDGRSRQYVVARVAPMRVHAPVTQNRIPVLG